MERSKSAVKNTVKKDVNITGMRQLLYISSSKPHGTMANVAKILEQSRHNNALDGVTGLLWTDGVRFLQVLEGPAESVAVTYARISADPRHQAIVVLSDKTVETREFGEWSMAEARAEGDSERHREHVARLLDRAAPDVRGTFLGLIEARKSVA